MVAPADPAAPPPPLVEEVDSVVQPVKVGRIRLADNVWTAAFMGFACATYAVGMYYQSTLAEFFAYQFGSQDNHKTLVILYGSRLNKALFAYIFVATVFCGLRWRSRKDRQMRIFMKKDAKKKPVRSGRIVMQDGLAPAPEMGPGVWSFTFSGVTTYHTMEDMEGKLAINPGVLPTQQEVSFKLAAYKPRPPTGFEAPLPTAESYAAGTVIMPDTTEKTRKSTFVIWARHPEKKLDGSPNEKYGNVWPDNYYKFAVLDKFHSSNPASHVEFCMYHTISQMRALKPDDTFVCVGFQTQCRTPLSLLSKSSTGPVPTDDQLTWLINPRKEVLEALTKPGCPPPKPCDYAHEPVCFAFDWEWSRLSGLRAMRFEPELTPGTPLSWRCVNNEHPELEGYVTGIVHTNPFPKRMFGCCQHSLANGGGGSSQLGFSAHDRVGVLHGGALFPDGTPVEFNNIGCPGEFLAQLKKKFEGKGWEPEYSRAFIAQLTKMERECQTIIDAEQITKVDIDVPEDDTDVIPSFGLEPIIESYNHVPRTQFQRTLKGTMARFRKKGRRLDGRTAAALAYAGFKGASADFDPALADAELRRLDEQDSLYGEGWDHYNDVWGGPTEGTGYWDPDYDPRNDTFLLPTWERKKVPEPPGLDAWVPEVQETLDQGKSEPVPEGEQQSEPSAEEEQLPTPTKKKLSVRTQPHTQTYVGNSRGPFNRQKKLKSEQHSVQMMRPTYEEALNRTILARLHKKKFDDPPEPTEPQPLAETLASQSLGYCPAKLHNLEYYATLPPSCVDYDCSKYKETVAELQGKFEPVPANQERDFTIAWYQFLAQRPDTLSVGQFFTFWEQHIGRYKGHLRNTDAFKILLGQIHQVRPKARTNRQHSQHLRFLGRTPYVMPSKDKTPKEPEYNKWFERWRTRYSVWEEPSETLGPEYPEGRAAGVFPPRGAQAEHDSVKYQLGTKADNPRVTDYESEHLRAYTAGQPAPTFDYDQPMAQFMKDIFLSMDKSCGSAWSKATGHPTKGLWMADRESLIALYLQMVLLMVYDHDTVLQWTPEQLFLAGILSPEEVFTKQEVHKRSKSDNKRWRVIWFACAAADALGRVFHNQQNKMEIALYQDGQTHSYAFPTFGSCPGMGHDDGGLEDMCAAMDRLLTSDGNDVIDDPNHERFGQRRNNGVSQDAKSWDMTVTRALWMADAWRRHSLALEGGAPVGYAYAIMNLGVVLSAHLIAIGGDVFEVQLLGILASGIPSTSASNSFMRGFLHSYPFQLLDKRFGFSLSMGDDNHSKDPVSQRHRDMWHRLGAIIEDSGEVIEYGAPVPFTSHNYDIDNLTATFGNAEKLLLRLCLSEEVKLTCDQAVGIRFAVRHTDGLREEVDAFVAAKDPAWVAIDVHAAGLRFDPSTVF